MVGRGGIKACGREEDQVFWERETPGAKSPRAAKPGSERGRREIIFGEGQARGKLSPPQAQRGRGPGAAGDFIKIKKTFLIIKKTAFYKNFLLLFKFAPGMMKQV
jgi:hypothetical protein